MYAAYKKSIQKQQAKQATVCDIMISYSHQDKDAMNFIKDAFEKAGLKVWVDVIRLQPGVDFLTKIGDAIIDSKLFVALLSESQVKSKYCKDELALAYVSNKSIFPISLQQRDVLSPMMDTGMRLQLARIDWIMMMDDESREASLKQLVSELKKHAHDVEKKSFCQDQRSSLHKSQTKKDLLLNGFCQVTESVSERTEKSFWDRHFGEQAKVEWKSFLDKFNGDYKLCLDKLFCAENGDSMTETKVRVSREWLVDILQRELNVKDGMITQDTFIDFCTVEEKVFSFWERVQDKAVESYTMGEVFNMESSVRVEAIENLGKFRSDCVVQALINLLSDADYNVRAVAAISLARTESDAPKVINALLECLDEKDRLVRESACLALGHLKAESAVMKLERLWRNDYISHVREAAKVALDQIGGEEAKKAMYITSVLSKEIRQLTED